MDQRIESGAKTVQEAAAKKFMDLVEQGVPQNQAAAEVGFTVHQLKKSGALGRVVKETLERAKNERLLEKNVEETVARVRRLELMSQDEDLKVALGAVKSVLDVAKPAVAVQINNNALLADPAVRESLASLQIDIEGEEQK